MKKLYAHPSFLLLPTLILCTLLLYSPTQLSAQTGLAARYLPDAEKGKASALTGLASCYENGSGVAEDYNEALRLYTLAALRKDPQAIFRIGYYYETGQGGLQKDFAEAFKYYNVAAAEGNGGAMLYLAELYEEGQGCEKNFEKALKLYLLSCVGEYSAKGAKRCALALGMDTLTLPKSNFDAYRKYAVGDNPDTRAMYGLYNSYRFGRDGIEKNEEIALVWLEQAAEGGLTEAQAEFGDYLNSKGQYAKAEKWLNKASLKGDQKSMELLADLISYGFSNASYTVDVVVNLYIGAGNFDKARSKYSNLNLISDSKLIEQQVTLFNYLNGASQPTPQPTPQITLQPTPQTTFSGQSQSTENQREPKRVLCSHCNGSGSICILQTVPTYGTHTNVKTRCKHCSELLVHGTVHIQRKCPHCQGKGYTLLY